MRSHLKVLPSILTSANATPGHTSSASVPQKRQALPTNRPYSRLSVLPRPVKEREEKGKKVAPAKERLAVKAKRRARGRAATKIANLVF